MGPRPVDDLASHDQLIGVVDVPSLDFLTLARFCCGSPRSQRRFPCRSTVFLSDNRTGTGMTVRIDRSFAVDASRERVWEFIVDPANRAQAISVVESYAIDDPEGRRATWQVLAPDPARSKTVTVNTEDDVTRRPPEYVKFVGESKVMDVTGEHEIVETDDGARLERTSSSTASSRASNGSSSEISIRNSRTSSARSSGTCRRRSNAAVTVMRSTRYRSRHSNGGGAATDER